MAFNAKRYRSQFTAAMAAYAASLVAASYAVSAIKPEGALLYAISLAPALPAIAATAVFFRHFATMDEMFRRLHAESFAASALIVGLASFAYGFVEDAAPVRISMTWVLPAIIAGWGAIVCVRQFLQTR